MVTLTSLTLICVVFALSCFCCTVMFIDTERSRMIEGMTFQEAYLIPIPIVAVVVDRDLHDDEDTVAQAPAGPRPEGSRSYGSAGDGDGDEDSLLVEVEAPFDSPFETPVAKAHVYSQDLAVAEPTQHSSLTHGAPARPRRR